MTWNCCCSLSPAQNCGLYHALFIFSWLKF
jgi:hypothetical protein